MPEKMKPSILRDVQSAEQVPESFVPTEAEETVLHALHAETDKHHREGGVPPKAETLGILHNNIAKTESFPLFREYVAGITPSPERMLRPLKSHIDVAKAALETDGSDEQAMQTLNLLSGREAQIRSSIGLYVRSVIRFKELQRISAGGVRDVTKQFSDADHARRRAHNNLIDSLRVYRDTLQKAVSEGLLPGDCCAEWSMGADARAIGADKGIMFSNIVLQNREFIRDWAIVADFAEQFAALGDDAWLETMRGHSS